MRVLSIPIVVFLAFVACQNVQGDDGKPWPATPEEYANFSQLNTEVYEVKDNDDVPLLMSAGAPQKGVVNLDMTKPNKNLADSLEEVLAPELADVKITDQQQIISITINIKPPATATMAFIKELQESVRTALERLVPYVGTTLKIAVTKTSTGKILNVKAYLKIVVPSASNKILLPPSNVPEIDLTKSTSGLSQSLKIILTEELAKAGYKPDSTSVQVFTLSFSILPPDGATKDYVKLEVLRPLLKVLKGIAPRLAITGISVKTQESGEKVLRQTINVSVRMNPPPQPTTTTQRPVTIENRNNFQEDETQNENVVPKNAIVTEVVDLTTPKARVDNIRKILEDELSPSSNPSDDGKPKILAIPFVMKPPKTATPEQFQEKVVKPLGKLLVLLEPTGVVVTSKAKVFPDGKVELIVYFEIPSVKGSKTYKDLEANLQKPTESTQATQEPVTKETQTEEPKTTPISKGVTEAPQNENEGIPKNAVLIPLIEMKNINSETFISDLRKKIDEMIKPNNNEPQIIGIPFVLSRDSLIVEIGLKKALEMIAPGKVLPETKTKKLPNGDIEYIVFIEVPPTTSQKPSVEEQTKPSVEVEKPKSREVVVSTTVQPQTSQVTSEVPNAENEEQPENAILIPPIDIKKNVDYQTLPERILREIDEVSKPNNDKPQIIGIPFILPQKNYLVEMSLKKGLEMILPGKVLPKTRTKKLPNGDVEYIVYVEKPATKKPSEKTVEEQTKPSVEKEAVSSTVLPETSEVPMTENEKQPENVILIPPIDLKNTKEEYLPEKILREVYEVGQPKNGKPQIIGIPIIMPKNGLSNLEELSLKKMLQAILPGKILPKSVTKNLPNGEVEYIIYLEKPSSTTEEQTEPSMKEGNEDIVFPTEAPETLETPETSETPETPETPKPTETPESSEAPETATQPENVILTTPILLEPFSFETIKDGIEERIEEIYKSNNGQKKLIGLPFVLPKEHSSPLLIEALENVLKILLPGKNLPVPQTKVLPNGDTEVIYYYELPPRKEVENLVEEKPVVEVDVDLDKPDASIPGEVGKALIRGIYKVTQNPENKGKPVILKLKVYTPQKNTVSENEEVIDLVSEQVKKLEPSAKVISAKAIPDRKSYEPDGVVEVEIPSVADTNSLLLIKNALTIPTIDLTDLEKPLEDTIKILLEKGLKSLGQKNPKGSQLFELSFKLDPYDLKGSRRKALEALKSSDLKGLIVSSKVAPRPDGLDYLEVCYLIPKVEDSVIIEIVKGEEPEVVQEAIVPIDSQNPMKQLLIKVITEVNGAVAQVKGVEKDQLVNLPLNFRFTNSDGMSDSRLSEVISKTLPYIKGYIGQTLPDGKILSVETLGVPNSDDVILKIVVRTPYQPDNKIIIEVQRPERARKPKKGSFFKLFDV